MTRQSPRFGFRAELIALVAALGIPSLVTWAYFFQAEGAPAVVQLIVFPAVKTLQFAFPAFWVFVAMREPLDLRRPSFAGVLVGVAFGGAVAAAIFLLYFLGLRDSQSFAAAAAPIRAKIAGFGIDTLPKYAALGLFYSLCHSLLEEYYWRWFVFGRLRRFSRLHMAVIVSSLGFMAHHVLVLGKFFGFAAWETWFFSISVAVGGAVWAVLYEHYKSLIGPWISHLLVDAAIFAVGYDLVGDALGA